MIARDVTPIGHVSPYRRIDPRYPNRKIVITREEVENGTREPDAAVYAYSYILDRWTLKDGM